VVVVVGGAAVEVVVDGGVVAGAGVEDPPSQAKLKVGTFAPKMTTLMLFES
jgi:hypothetical protein